jgi:8-oxo-dGTP pyrophosphatase MutT (NUDIX family)
MRLVTIEAIRRRLSIGRPPRDPRERMLEHVEGPVSPEVLELLERPGREASVLLAIVERPAGFTMLFTERAAHLKDHPGQISFPGGRIAAGETAVEAALREAYEEVGLLPADVATLGTLDTQLTGTGFTITPVVGFVAGERFTPAPDPTEVAGVFEVPLEIITEPTSIVAGYLDRLGSRFRTYELYYEHYRIWGATAAILSNFREVLLDEKT